MLQFQSILYKCLEKYICMAVHTNENGSIILTTHKFLCVLNILNNHYNHKNNHNLVLLHENIRLDLIIYYLFCILMHIEFYAK